MNEKLLVTEVSCPRHKKPAAIKSSHIAAGICYVTLACCIYDEQEVVAA